MEREMERRRDRKKKSQRMTKQGFDERHAIILKIRMIYQPFATLFIGQLDRASGNASWDFQECTMLERTSNRRHLMEI